MCYRSRLWTGESRLVSVLASGAWGCPSRETIVRVAERAEQWGVDSFWLADQIRLRTPDLDVVAVLRCWPRAPRRSSWGRAFCR